jgi:hypothetical protein
MRDASGNFAVEVYVLPSSDDRPHTGGLLVCKDEELLRLEIGVYGPGEVTLQRHMDRRKQVIGRGLLPTHDNESAYLRLERMGDRFTAYCSTEGKEWFRVGSVIFPLEDPVEVGLFAMGYIWRAIYTGVDDNGMSYPDGTATVFRDFRIWTKP